MASNKKTGYNCIVVMTDGRFFKYRAVMSPYKLTQWVATNIGEWKHMNVYKRPEGNFIAQYKNGDYIPSKP